MKLCKDCVVGVLGACSLDYCRTEREALIEQAQHAAAQHGHELSAFEKVKDYPIWEARCTRCGRQVGVNLNPQPGTPDVYGEALNAGCSTT